MKAKTPSKAEQLRQLRLRHSDASGRSLALAGRFSTTAEVFHVAQPTKSTVRSAFRHLYSFFFFMMSLLLVWGAYRWFVRAPIWFDEGIAKAIVFGLPTFWLAARSRFIAQNIGLDVNKILPGLYLGTAVGGLYGFAALFSMGILGREVVSGSFFLSYTFWYMAGLALLTAWWESMFFFGLPVQFLKSIAGWISDWWIGVFVTVFFLLFHAPLRFVLTGGSAAFASQMGILTLFVIGQFVLYTRTKNLYALVLSHFFWGLVLEVYTLTVR